MTKACSSGADAVILDLEDAVDAGSKDWARQALIDSLEPAQVPLLVRINGQATQWSERDQSACADLPIQAVMLPKAESAKDCEAVAHATGKPVVALIESAQGLANIVKVAGASTRIAFGSIDYAADLGIAHLEHTLLHARSTIVHAACLAGQQAPFDGVTADLHNMERIAKEARHGCEMGFGGKLLIHPAQIEPAKRGSAPTDEDVAWAKRVMEAAEDSEAALQVDGAMVDAPVVKRAASILQRAERS